MRVLAIDTALEACSVAVLDTGHADARVHESLPMQRGHAEALMPLVARVLERAISIFLRSIASPSPPDPAASQAYVSALPPRAE